MVAAANPFIVRAAAAAPAGFDPVAVRQAADILFDPVHGVQIQGLPSGRSRVVPGGDMESVVKAVEWLADEPAVGRGGGVYWTLNPVPAGLPRPVRVPDVLRRRWLLIDIDPHRPADVSATEAEHDAAMDGGAAVIDYLTQSGWPLPVIVDSGNGWHLLYRIDLPNDDTARVTVRGVLQSLSDQFSNDKWSVDQAVYNANRISKLPGTYARKGPHTFDRPHRMARLHYAPEFIEVVPLEMLAALAALTASDNSPPPLPELPAPASGPLWRLRAGGGNDRPYFDAAIRAEAARVRMASKGQRNTTLNDASFRLGTLTGTYPILRQQCESELLLAASVCGLPDDEAQSVIKRALAAGMEHPRPKLEPKPSSASLASDPHGTTAQNGVTAESSGVEWELQIDGEVVEDGDPACWLPDASGVYTGQTKRHQFELLTLQGLMAREYPPIKWVVPGILSAGLNILAGKPKLGKSMLALNLAITVSNGGKALGNIQTAPGDVLYLALEDRGSRLQSRARKMLRNHPVNRRLKMATQFPMQDDGGLDLIAHWARNYCEMRPALVIVDVWNKFRTPIQAKGNVYDQDYAAMGQLKALADSMEFACLIVHHCRKSQGQDVVEEISGSTGLSGAADGIMALTRSRGESEATVFVTGRDVTDQELILKFNDETLTWESQGPADQHVAGRLQTSIVEFLRTTRQALHNRDIATAIGEDNIESVRITLWKLHRQKIIRRQGSAWVYPFEDDEPDGIDP